MSTERRHSRSPHCDTSYMGWGAAPCSASAPREGMRCKALSIRACLIVCAELLYYLGARATREATLLAEQLAVGGRLVAVHPSDRVDALHATCWRDSSLQLIGSERVADTERPYRIDVFERAGRRDQG